jgi:hypothetical protein
MVESIRNGRKGLTSEYTSQGSEQLLHPPLENYSRFLVWRLVTLVRLVNTNNLLNYTWHQKHWCQPNESDQKSTHQDARHRPPFLFLDAGSRRNTVLRCSISRPLFLLDGAVGLHDVGDSQKAQYVGARVQVAPRVELGGGRLDVLVDPGDIFGQQFVGGASAEAVHDHVAREGHVVRPVQQSSLFEDLAGRRGHDGMSAFEDPLAAVVGEDFDRVGVELAKGAARDAVVVRDVQNVALAELGRGRANDVAAQQRAPLVLDLVDGPQLAGTEAIGLVHESARVGKGEGNGAHAQQLGRHRPGNLPTSQNQNALAGQRIALVLEHLAGVVDDAVPRSL